MNLLNNPSQIFIILGILVIILVLAYYFYLFFKEKIFQKVFGGVTFTINGIFGLIFMFLFFYPIHFLYHAKHLEDSNKQEKQGWFDDVGWIQLFILHVPILIIWFVSWIYLLVFLINKL